MKCRIIIFLWKAVTNMKKLKYDTDRDSCTLEGYGGFFLRHFQQYFSYIVAVSFIGGGNRSTRRKQPTCHKYTSPERDSSYFWRKNTFIFQWNVTIRSHCLAVTKYPFLKWQSIFSLSRRLCLFYRRQVFYRNWLCE